MNITDLEAIAVKGQSQEPYRNMQELAWDLVLVYECSPLAVYGDQAQRTWTPTESSPVLFPKAGACGLEVAIGGLFRLCAFWFPTHWLTVSIRLFGYRSQSLYSPRTFLCNCRTPTPRPCTRQVRVFRDVAVGCAGLWKISIFAAVFRRSRRG